MPNSKRSFSYVVKTILIAAFSLQSHLMAPLMPIDDWFNSIALKSVLSTRSVQELHDAGFVVLPGLEPPVGSIALAQAYDSAVASACLEDVSIGSSTTRVNDFVNRGPEFDELYLFQPILEACCRIIGQPFKLSTMLARTLRPHTPAQGLHVDFRSDAKGWPMVGFIIMIDEFRNDNGATRFVPGSHHTRESPANVIQDVTANYEGQVLACGAAGSVIIYNGSTWHGHTANQSLQLRRSIQGAFIRRDAQAAVNQRNRILPETLGRIGNLAKYLLDVEPYDEQQAPQR